MDEQLKKVKEEISGSVEAISEKVPGVTKMISGTLTSKENYWLGYFNALPSQSIPYIF